MKKTIYKITAGMLSAALIFSGAGVNAKADTKGALSALTSLLEETNIKDSETVYVIASADGTAKKVMVSTNEKQARDCDDLNDLPVAIKAKFTLDDKEIKASEIEGATGKLVIRFDYENKKTVDVNIDGKKESAHIPFTVNTGLVLDNDRFKNIEVSNGKIVNDGNKTLIIGVAYPSLAKDLKVNAEDMKLYDYVEIKADVIDAEWTNVYTVVSNTVFSALSEGEGSVVEGDSLKKLVDGVGELSQGSKELYEGMGSLKDGATQLSGGVDSLSNGLSSISSNSAKLNAGAAQVFDTLLGTANSTIAKSGANLPALTAENYGTVLGMAIAGLQAAGDNKTAAALGGLKNQLDSYNAFYQGLLAYTGGVNKASAGAKTLKENLPELVNGIDALEDGAGKLSDGIEEFSEETIGKLGGDDNMDTASIYERFKALSDASSEFGSYTSDASKDGFVRFVYKLETK